MIFGNRSFQSAVTCRQHLLTRLSFREYCWLFLWGLASLLGVRVFYKYPLETDSEYKRLLRVIPLVHSLNYTSAHNKCIFTQLCLG